MYQLMCAIPKKNILEMALKKQKSNSILKAFLSDTLRGVASEGYVLGR